MDLHLIPGAVASAGEQQAIDAAIGAQAPERHLLLPALHAAQACRGWITPGALNHICMRLSVPPAEAYGVASFYAMFATKPRAPRTVHVCDDIACRVKGAEAVCRSLEARFGPAGQDAAGTSGLAARRPATRSQTAMWKSMRVVSAPDSFTAETQRTQRPAET